MLVGTETQEYQIMDVFKIQKFNLGKKFEM